MDRQPDPLELWCAQHAVLVSLCPTLRKFLVRWSALCEEPEFRARCVPIASRVATAAVDEALEARRSYRIVDWALRGVASTWFTLAGLDDLATALRERAPITCAEDLIGLAELVAEARASVTASLLVHERGARYEVGTLTATVSRVGRESGWFAAWAVGNMALADRQDASRVSGVWFDAWCAVADAVRIVFLADADADAIARGLAACQASGLALLDEVAALRRREGPARAAPPTRMTRITRAARHAHVLKVAERVHRAALGNTGGSAGLVRRA
ncbi:MAG: hypothetical protein KC635_04175 [Myxococcales bacterium]|nr:hypothetical protein [Myxococcales bacterium]MCB9733510.1 hypothetical protein [Deltaproteobacteria bacterium]